MSSLDLDASAGEGRRAGGRHEPRGERSIGRRPGHGRRDRQRLRGELGGAERDEADRRGRMASTMNDRRDVETGATEASGDPGEPDRVGLVRHVERLALGEDGGGIEDARRRQPGSAQPGADEIEPHDRPEPDRDGLRGARPGGRVAHRGQLRFGERRVEEDEPATRSDHGHVLLDGGQRVLGFRAGAEQAERGDLEPGGKLDHAFPHERAGHVAAAGHERHLLVPERRRLPDRARQLESRAQGAADLDEVRGVDGLARAGRSDRGSRQDQERHAVPRDPTEQQRGRGLHDDEEVDGVPAGPLDEPRQLAQRRGQDLDARLDAGDLEERRDVVERERWRERRDRDALAGGGLIPEEAADGGELARPARDAEDVRRGRGRREVRDPDDGHAQPPARVEHGRRDGAREAGDHDEIARRGGGGQPQAARVRLEAQVDLRRGAGERLERRRLPRAQRDDDELLAARCDATERGHGSAGVTVRLDHEKQVAIIHAPSIGTSVRRSPAASASMTCASIVAKPVASTS